MTGRGDGDGDGGTFKLPALPAAAAAAEVVNEPVRPRGGVGTANPPLAADAVAAGAGDARTRELVVCAGAGDCGAGGRAGRFEPAALPVRALI